MKHLAWVLLLAACGGGDDARECATSSECVQGNIPGECRDSTESEKMFCAYPDGTCANSGQRWGVAAGDGLAGECVAGGGVDAGGEDANRIDAGGVDAGPPTLVTWSEPQLLQNVNTRFLEGSPSVSKNGLELYFISDRPGGTGKSDVYVARRNSTEEPFGTPSEVVEVNSQDDERRVELSESGLELYVQRGLQTDISNIFLSKRATPAAVWSEPERVDFEGDVVFFRGYSLSGDGLTMYLVDSACTAKPCIRRVTRPAIGQPWSRIPDEPDAEFSGLNYSDVDIAPDLRTLVLCEPREAQLAAAVQAVRLSSGAPFLGFETITNLPNGVTDCAFNTNTTELYMSVDDGDARDLAVSLPL